MELFSLFATIGLKDSGFNQGIDDATEKGRSFGDKFGAVVTGVGKAAVAGLAVAGTAFVALSQKALSLGGELEQNLGGAEAVFGDFADTLIERGSSAFDTMGLSASDFLATANKMGALMQGSGIDVETSMELSSSAMQRAADVASIMGIDVGAAMESIAGAAKGNFTMMDNLGVAMNATTIEAYALSQGITTSYNEMDNAQKVGLAMEMFLEKTAYAAGNYAKENETLAGSLATAKAALGNFLSGAGDADALVGAFSNAADVIVGKITELLPRLTEGLAQVVGGLLPQIEPLFSALIPAAITGATSLFSGFMQALPGIVAVVSDTIPMVVGAILTMLPMMLDTGMTTLTTLIDGISQMLPDLIPVAIDAIFTLVDGLINNLPELLTAALALITGFAEGLISALPEIIARLPEIISAIVSFLTGSAPQIITAGIALLTALITNLPEIIATIVTAVPEIVGGIVSAFGDLADDVIGIGKSLLEGIWEGISNAGGWLWEQISGFFNGVVGKVKGLFGVKSPSTVFAEIGGNLNKGLVQGVRDTLDMVGAVMSDVVKLATTPIAEMPEEVSALGEYIVAAMADIVTETKTALVDGMSEITLFPAGQEIMDSMISGINSKASAVVDAARNIGSSVTGATKSTSASGGGGGGGGSYGVGGGATGGSFTDQIAYALTVPEESRWLFPELKEIYEAAKEVGDVGKYDKYFAPGSTVTHVNKEANINVTYTNATATSGQIAAISQKVLETL